MRLLIFIALKHLLARKRQSIVSLMGIVLGVGFFLAISSIMQGSEADFIKRLVDNSPHITVSDEFRDPRIQPIEKTYGDGAIEISGVKPLTETRGIRGYQKIMSYLENQPDMMASPVLVGSGIISFAGQEKGVTINGMIPEEIHKVSTISDYMEEGSVERLESNADGILVGITLAKNLSLSMNDTISVSAQGGRVRTFKIVGIFKTGRGGYDRSAVFTTLKRAQVLLGRTNRINNILIKMDDPNTALIRSKEIEKIIRYKSESWQESSEDLMSTLAIRNMIMYTVVSAVLVVAAFGIYNVISTVVMEKHRDIAILKSMGFPSADIRMIFLIQGVLLGVAGNMAGIPLGSVFIKALQQIKFRPPGSTEPISMPVSWGWEQFAIAATFALCASVLASFLPARKASHVQPVDILRGGL
ncbi:MAG: ABC transporter permease [Alphaproteobacteria bacterium]|nr:ABC transporter permease [Alphaproteobacteria bacterium]MCB9985943.1 ABC transporter permease [Micavibrio sp.]HPQ50207.1 ABC transporter permease [Alphaproteobacteria bacterium]